MESDKMRIPITSMEEEAQKIRAFAEKLARETQLSFHSAMCTVSDLLLYLTLADIEKLYNEGGIDQVRILAESYAKLQ